MATINRFIRLDLSYGDDETMNLYAKIINDKVTISLKPTESVGGVEFIVIIRQSMYEQLELLPSSINIIKDKILSIYKSGNYTG